MSFTTLGKRNHKILREVELPNSERWVNGEFIETPFKELIIRANIQPSTMSYKTKMLPSGDREKEAISIYSNHWLHIARTGQNPLKADVVLYRGARWEVVVSKPYGNFGEHCEALAVRIDDSLPRRDEGVMGVIV